MYALAATTDPDVRILAGHHRIQVSADGGNVLGVQPMSRGCLITDGAPPPSERAGAFVTHFLTGAPLESHVYISLTYRVPLLVKTPDRTWVVDGDTVNTVVVD